MQAGAEFGLETQADAQARVSSRLRPGKKGAMDFRHCQSCLHTRTNFAIVAGSELLS